MIKTQLPHLPYDSWTDTRLTIHLILQIIGKTRLGLTARKNHWWFITIYVSSRGFSTFTIPIDDGLNSLQIELDVLKRAVVITHSAKGEVQIKLEDGLSVAQFYNRFIMELNLLGIKSKYVDRPYDMGIDKPFEELSEYNSYHWDSIEKFWQLMRWNSSILQEFSGRFYGKTSPTQIFWHHMDLAVTRFSGKKLDPLDKSAPISDRDTYSHEQISFGFWVGDDNVPEPAYYSYTYPSPDGMEQEVLMPETASWVDANGSPMAFLRYEDVRMAENPRQVVLDFLESAYQAGANLAKWPVDELTTPTLKNI